MTLRDLNPNQPAVEFRPIQQIVDHATSPRRFFVLLVGIFAGLGLLLASLGILWGDCVFGDASGRRRSGLRMALGARPGARGDAGVLGKTLGLVADLDGGRTVAVSLVATRM